MDHVNNKGKELILSRKMSHVDTKKWIEKVEEKMKGVSVTDEKMVGYATQFHGQDAMPWWEMHKNIDNNQGKISWEEFKVVLLQCHLVTHVTKTQEDVVIKTIACKVCGDIGHTYNEHLDQCPYCDVSHPGEICPTSQVTCFLCEGTNHIPAQCQLYSVVQNVNHHVMTRVHQAL